jgi:hypothetical protein
MLRHLLSMACSAFCVASSRRGDRGRSKFTFVVCYDQVTKCKCLSGDKQVVGADSLAGSLKSRTQ